MPKLQCELCGRAEDKASGPGEPREAPPASPRPEAFACELCAKQFQSPPPPQAACGATRGSVPVQDSAGASPCTATSRSTTPTQMLKEFVCQYCNKAFTLGRTLRSRKGYGRKRYHLSVLLSEFCIYHTKRNHEQRHIRGSITEGLCLLQCPKICKTAA